MRKSSLRCQSFALPLLKRLKNHTSRRFSMMKKLLGSLTVYVMMLTGVFSQASSAAELTTLSEVAGKPVEVQVTVGAAWFHQFEV